MMEVINVAVVVGVIVEMTVVTVAVIHPTFYVPHPIYPPTHSTHPPSIYHQLTSPIHFLHPPTHLLHPPIHPLYPHTHLKDADEDSVDKLQSHEMQDHLHGIVRTPLHAEEPFHVLFQRPSVVVAVVVFGGC